MASTPDSAPDVGAKRQDRLVRANLAISVVPREVAEPYAATYGLRVLPLVEPWARRHFAICFRDETVLSAAAKLLVNHLTRVRHSQAG